MSISFYLGRKSFLEHPLFLCNRLLRFHEPDLGHTPIPKPTIGKEEGACYDWLRTIYGSSPRDNSSPGKEASKSSLQDPEQNWYSINKEE